ncbi:heterokaryon incompatibility protein-domain-containing protein [Podospora didyma]|uniref:Heterokaryon incompatibility protein-domain-containing protein n=1 Tax=Podospora didyma TaxID=330526 RepID=A0AAE0NZT1_9PEZI|nr:heterokaryon incompatibility protein-domain-containing protein [Podospora didyma]
MSEHAHSNEPLSADRSIRILLLEPAPSLDKPLRGSLCEIALAFNPEYHALSYVWGAPDALAGGVISITAHDTDCHLSISAICSQALMHLRHTEKFQLLWVDAICIDQTSDAEKSTQVGVMADVYRQAAKVVAWLDLGQLCPRRAKSVLILARHITFLFESGLVGLDETKSAKARIAGYLPEKVCRLRIRSHIDTLVCILLAPYFNRIWTVQEMSMAQPDCLDLLPQAPVAVVPCTTVTPLYCVTIWILVKGYGVRLNGLKNHKGSSALIII